MTLAFFVLTQYRLVDRQTDGRTVRHVAVAKTRTSIASRGKKVLIGNRMPLICFRFFSLWAKLKLLLHYLYLLIIS